MEKGDSSQSEARTIGGRYAIERVLGQGGMGKVYLARDTMLGGELVALKVLLPELSRDPKHHQRFLREVQLTRKINHPNVIKTFDVGTDVDGSLFLTMEYIEGSTLKEKLSQGTLATPEAIRILKEVALGLAQVHAADVIHRDLKPGNVMLGINGTVKISDFGVARPGMSDLTSHEEIIGCAPYIAPEVWLGKGLGPPSDIYALGVLAYEMVVDELPFEAGSPAELMRKHLHSKPMPPRDLNSDVPTWLNYLILELLDKDPTKRPSCEEIAQRLEQGPSLNPDAQEAGGSQAALEGGLLSALEQAEAKVRASQCIEAPLVTGGLKKPHGTVQLTAPNSPEQLTNVALVTPTALPSESASQPLTIRQRRASGEFFPEIQTVKDMARAPRRGSGLSGGVAQLLANLSSYVWRILPSAALLLTTYWGLQQILSPWVLSLWHSELNAGVQLLGIAPALFTSLLLTSALLSLPAISILMLTNPVNRVRALVLSCSHIAGACTTLLFVTCSLHLMRNSAWLGAIEQALSLRARWSIEAALQQVASAVLLAPPIPTSGAGVLFANTSIGFKLDWVLKSNLLHFILMALLLMAFSQALHSIFFKGRWKRKLTASWTIAAGLTLPIIEMFFADTLGPAVGLLQSAPLLMPLGPFSVTLNEYGLACGAANWSLLLAAVAVLKR